ncbi:MAG: hypothetical protein JXR79_07705 [Nitrospirae bacterium]|nr:hypothetical protein [Nitrospirota bacterium]
MPVEYIALLISIFSVLVAAFSLGWNIYRDIILKAKVKVSFAVITIIHETMPDRPQFLNIKATNFGPGPVTINMICLKESNAWRRLFRKTKYGIITSDCTDPLSSKLPAKIEVGDKIDLFLPYNKDSFLSLHFNHVGINDCFGRDHWAPRRDFKKAYAEWSKDFQNET